MNRIEKLREFVDEVLLVKKDADDRRCAYVHLYGVALLCGLIAKKRAANEELAVMAGMLHDLYTYKAKNDVGYDDDKTVEIMKNHAEDGAVYAREVLDALDLTIPEETNAICTAIHNHSNKDGTFSELDEILIDADVMQHYFYNPLFPVKAYEQERLERLLSEFGMSSAV